MNQIIKTALLWIGGLGLVAGVTFLAVYRGACVFEQGAMVRMRAFGTGGMVVGARGGWVDGSPCLYSVRFSALQLRTNTRLLGPDGLVVFVPVALVRNIREYELEKAVPDRHE